MSKLKIDALAQSYFEKFLVRVEVLPEYHKRKAYSEVIRESQEALELFIKALLRVMGWSPSHSHNPGKELSGLKEKVPASFQAMTNDLIKWSKSLRRERELSFYGAADFIPTEEYTLEDSESVIGFLEKVAKQLKIWLKTV